VGKTISANKPEEIGKQYAKVKAIHADRFVSDAEAALYFFASDAVIISYEGEYRKGSGVLVEACRFGRPVIASNTGHLRDFVRSHGCGLLFEQGSPESLTAVIDRFAAMPEELRRSLELNAQNAAATYSWDHLIDDYIRIYVRPFTERGKPVGG
jgi:glycosyltransferase involved in cell wall biosynthesis